jgi:hypothetical protein
MMTEMMVVSGPSTDPWQPTPPTPQKKVSQHNGSMLQQQQHPRYIHTVLPPDSPQFSSE